MSKIGKYTVTESRLGVAQGVWLGEWRIASLVMGIGILVGMGVRGGVEQ